MNKRLLRIQLVSVAFIVIMLSGFVPQAVWAGQVFEQEKEIFPRPFMGYDVDSIYVFYDPTDETMRAVAEGVDEIASYRINGIQLIPVTSYAILEASLNDEPWIAIYALRSDLDTVIFEDNEIEWHHFYKLLSEHRSTQHVVGMGNTLSLDMFLTPADDIIHHSETEVVDGLILILYDLWAIKEIAETRAHVDDNYAGVAEDLEIMVMDIYADQFSELFQRSVEPINPVGEMDPVAAEARKAAMWAEHQPVINDAAYRIDEDGSLVELPLDDLPEDFSPAVALTSEAEVAAGDFLLGLLPDVSGLRGPIGTVVDFLLDVLIGAGKTALSIPEDALGDLMDIFDDIIPFLGIFDDFSLDSPLKSLFDAIAGEFPFPADMTGFLWDILESLFNLRNLDDGIDGIVDVLMGLVEGLLPAILPIDVMTFINGMLDMGGDLWDLLTDMVSGGKGAFDGLLSFLVNQVMGGLVEKTVTEQMGVGGDITDFLYTTGSFVASFIDFLVSFDFDNMLDYVGTDLLNLALGILTGPAGQLFIERVISFAKMLMSIFEMVDEFDFVSTANFFMEFLEFVVGEENFIEDAAGLVTELLEVLQQFVEDPGSVTVSSFEAEIAPILDAGIIGSVGQAVKNIITDVLVIMGWLYEANFNPLDVSSFFDIVLDMAGEFVPSELAFVVGAVDNLLEPLFSLIAEVADIDGLKKMIGVTLELYNDDWSDPVYNIAQVIIYIAGPLFTGISDVEDVMRTLGSIILGIGEMIYSVKDFSFQGIMKSLLMIVGSVVGIFPSFDGVPIDGFLKLLQGFFPESFDFMGDFETPSAEEIVQFILGSGPLTGIFDAGLLEDFIEFLFDIKGIFTDGVQWLLSKAFDWITGQITPLLTMLETSLNSMFGGFGDLLGHNGMFPIGLGEWSLFEVKFDLGIKPQFHINPTPFFEYIRQILFEGRNPFTLDSVAEFFYSMSKFFEITPQFYAELGVSGFDSSKNQFMEVLLDVLGVGLSFSGSAKFVMNLFSFRDGMWEWDEFFHILEWGLSLHVALDKTMTLLDFITGGVGGGVLSKLAEYIGLGGISVRIWFGLDLDIVKKAATAIAAETSTLSLVVTIGASISLGIDIIIAAASLKGTLEIVFSFFQDFGNDVMKILLRLTLTLKLKIRFTFISKTWKWTWEPGGPWDLSPSPGSSEYEGTGMGHDHDNDGLSDDYEDSVPGLDKYNPDTDGDGASDKLEVQTMSTDPMDPDSDDDGLTDGEEWDIGTNPNRADTDWDKISDYDEVRVYFTDPFSQDTDGDALTDYHEINHAYNMSGVWVLPGTEITVTIGGIDYMDHTDPLVADTDGDGLVDGDEGPTGAYYGLASLYNDTPGSGMDPNPLIFNSGYTHPLDPDTDDDSYQQLYNGMVDTQFAGGPIFFLDMSDGKEVAGFWITLYDDEGEPYDKQVFTNPCNPDTDGDTGITDRTPLPGVPIISDGYELAQSPPTDPTDGDTDDDGLLDGLEGVGNPMSNHTDPLDPDTDDDGLFDMQEILLGTDPLAQDTDGDMVSDGDEFYKYHTNPSLADTDLDGLGDGEELFFEHSNPLIDDSDADGIVDGDEVLLYFSDPMDEDGDNDGLTDYEEIFVYYTDPFDYDTDDDGLSDGAEILYYSTDPREWDTDLDSITEPDEFGHFTWPMSDYDEIMTYGTNATEADSDLDGLSDSIELYLGSGNIPWLDPIPLNPLSNDTDNDFLTDGSELLLVNVSDIVYPFVSVTVVFRFNTSPVLRDTDNDTLIDYQEVIVFNSNPANPDTDNDTIPDWWEIWVYNTSALTNDTDGDELYDWEETLTEVYPFGPWPPDNWSIGIGGEEPAAMAGFSLAEEEYVPAQDYTPPTPLYGTSAFDWDSDDDWLPDGGEVLLYGSDPMDDDSDNDGIKDTLEFDTDYDGLQDGLEFKLGLQQLPGGGIFQPDSDQDGVLDGDEYYIYGTDPANKDSDGDGYPDGLEILLGLDPLAYTEESEFQLALAVERGQWTILINMPANGSEVYQNTPVQVYNFTGFQEMWFRFKNGTDDWHGNFSLEYNVDSQLWFSDEVRWTSGQAYELQVFARNTTGVIHAQTAWFTTLPGDDPFWFYVAIGAVAVFAVVVLLGVAQWKTGIPGRGLRWMGRGVKSGLRKISRGRLFKEAPPEKKPAKKTTKSTKSTKKTGPAKGKEGGA